MTIDDELRAIVAKTTGLQASDLADEDHVHDHLGLSSLDLIAVYGYFEDKYEISISDSEADEVLTLLQLQQLIQSKAAAGSQC
ncbi:acyl carrier protein [Rhodococcus qingshengii]|uniref:Acyl carrier protein n=2 Tax=Rhodococcus erythropolis group TaxID=2840174 RepID=S6B6L9_RHOER|nr:MULTISPECIES: acyl carrier protein [Rhodococcus]MCD2131423.1 acyl carrier protein [Rhodococcus qingshengii]UPU40839.1 acyl carrier protein [Rhodococcus qingshengii JCM 15477]BAN59737.1 acyl carrier protein [Rhodococcus erythropolis]